MIYIEYNHKLIQLIKDKLYWILVIYPNQHLQFTCFAEYNIHRV